MNKTLILLLIQWFALTAMAQDQADETVINQPMRIEFEIDKREGDFTIISAKEKGLFVVQDTRDKHIDGFMWKFHMLNTALETSWMKHFPVAYGYQLKGYDHSLDNIFLLYETSQYRLEELFLMKFNLLTGDTLKFFINTVFPININFFEVVDHTIIIGGYANDRPVVLTYNVFEGKPKVLPGYYGNNSRILDIVTNDELRTFTVVSTRRLIDKRLTIATISYDNMGNEIQTILLNPMEDHSFTDGTTTLMANGDQIVAGTYARRRSEYSRGLYVASVTEEFDQSVKYHNYGDLQNFFSYMRAKRETRVKERIERRKITGKKIKFNYRLLVHQIIERDNEYILIGEAYYPKYNNTGSMSPMAYYQMPWYSQRNISSMGFFLGYKYTHAVVVSFDKKGNVNWDNSFEINDVLSPGLKKYVHASVEDDKIVLLYIYEGTIRSKIISGSQILEGKAFDDVRLTFEFDEIKEFDKSVEGLEDWYGKVFYAYGIQDIRNTKNENVKLNRKIFYINKITYD